MNASQERLGPHGMPALPVSGQEMAVLCKSPQSQALLAMPGGVVEFVPNGSVNAASIDKTRNSYINAIMIQSRGSPLSAPCTQCFERWSRGRNTPFPVCHAIAGHMGGCCGNCKWSDWGKRCSYSSGAPSAIESSAPGIGQAITGSVQNPILLEDNDDGHGNSGLIALKEDNKA